MDRLWGSDLKGEPCEKCPHKDEVCMLQGRRPPAATHTYNLVFAFEKPNPGSLYRGQVVDRELRAVIEAAIAPIQRQMTAPLDYAVVYAVGAATKRKPGIAEIEACSTYLRGKLEDLDARLQMRRGEDRPPNVLVAFGQAVTRSLGIQEPSIKKLRGRPHVVRALGSTWHVIPTHSLREVYGSGGGVTKNITADIRLALRVLWDEFTPLGIDQITSNYVFPQTEDEIDALVDQVLAYSGAPGVEPDAWFVACDFESNTLRMHADFAKAISFSVAWDRGRAASWLLDHREQTLDRARVWAATMRLLLSPKRKLWHNYKFDCKVIYRVGRMFDQDPGIVADMRPYLSDEHYALLSSGRAEDLLGRTEMWADTILFEHVLNESGQGNYSLKLIAYDYAPEYGGYESQLKDILAECHADLVADAAQYVTYPTAAQMGYTVPAKYQDVHDLEQKYIKAAFLRAVAPKKSERKAAYAKEADSLRNRIRTRYKYIDGAELPPTAEVDTVSALDDHGSFEELPVDVLHKYGAVDSDLTRIICVEQGARMRDQGRTYVQDVRRDALHVVTRVTGPMSSLLGRMEYRGVRLDVDLLAHYRDEATKLRASFHERMCNLVCQDFNPNSPYDLRKIIIDVLDVPWQGLPKTDSGELSTGKKTMEILTRNYPGEMHSLFAHLLTSWKGANRTVGTYLSQMDRALEAGTHRVHPSFWLISTVTGRLSVTNPAFQTLPKYLCRTKYYVPWEVIRDRGVTVTAPDGRRSVSLSIGSETFSWALDGDIPGKGMAVAESFDGFSIKRLLIPSPGMAFFNGDIASAEIRILCLYLGAEDPLTRAIQRGLNAPSYVAARVFWKDIHRKYLADAPLMDTTEQRIDAAYAYLEVHKETDWELGRLRTACKRVLYGIVYGSGDETCAEQIYGYLAPDGSSERQEQVAYAASVREGLYDAFPGIPEFLASMEAYIRANAYVRSPFGRYRRFPLMELDRKAQAAAVREGINYMAQSPASDALGIGATTMEPDLRLNYGGHILLLVHDAIAGEVPYEHIDKLGGLFDRHVVDGVARVLPKLPVKYEYELEVGINYKDMIPWRAAVDGELTSPDDLAIARAIGLG